MSEGIITAPEGIRFDINIFATTTNGDLDSVIELKDMRSVAPFQDGINPKALLSHLPALDGLEWRLMTDDEIADYRKRQKEEEAELSEIDADFDEF